MDIINITISNLTVAQPVNEALNLSPFASALLSILPWIMIFGLLYRQQITSLFISYRVLKGLAKRYKMGVILFAHDVDIKACNEMEMLLRKAEEKNIKEIILILDTFGGMEFAVSRIINAIQNYKGKIYAYVPRYSMSAGSLIALSCDKLYMSKTASLGAVDPQIGILFWVHSSKAWQEIVKKKGIKANDESIAMSLYAEQYTKLIRSYLDKIKNLNGKDDFKNFMTNGDIPHAQQLGIKDLQKWDIEVKDIMPWEIMKIIGKNPKIIKATF